MLIGNPQKSRKVFCAFSELITCKDNCRPTIICGLSIRDVQALDTYVHDDTWALLFLNGEGEVYRLKYSWNIEVFNTQEDYHQVIDEFHRFCSPDGMNSSP